MGEGVNGAARSQLPGELVALLLMEFVLVGECVTIRLVEGVEPGDGVAEATSCELVGVLLSDGVLVGLLLTGEPVTDGVVVGVVVGVLVEEAVAELEVLMDGEFEGLEPVLRDAVAEAVTTAITGSLAVHVRVFKSEHWP